MAIEFGKGRLYICKKNKNHQDKIIVGVSKVFLEGQINVTDLLYIMYMMLNETHIAILYIYIYLLF